MRGYRREVFPVMTKDDETKLSRVDKSRHLSEEKTSRCVK